MFLYNSFRSLFGGSSTDAYSNPGAVDSYQNPVVSTSYSSPIDTYAGAYAAPPQVRLCPY